MKKNSIFRIVAWSLTIVCLTSILLSGLGLRSYRSHTIFDRTNPVAATAVTAPVVEISETVTLGKAAAVHSSPSLESSVYEELKAGTQITIQRRETISSQVWAYISTPVSGWILLENPQSNTEHHLELMPPAATAAEEIATLASAATVYSSPSTEGGGHNGELEAGTEITITRRELVNNQEWAYTPAPIQGWVLAENLETTVVEVTGPASPMEPTSPSMSEIYGSSMLAEGVSAISIDWRAGFIRMIPTAGDRITIEETLSDYPMVWKVKNGKLSIDYCEEGFSLSMPKEKDLVIHFPMDWICQELDIDAASSQMVIQALTVNTVDIDTASGKTEFVDCTVGSLEVETASGDIFFVGSLDSLECDAASANFIATLNNHPRMLEMNSASGSMDLTLPSDTGFTVRMEGLKNVFSSDFATTVKNGAYVCGNGACRIEMESMSGGIYIQNADNL